MIQCFIESLTGSLKSWKNEFFLQYNLSKYRYDVRAVHLGNSGDDSITYERSTYVILKELVLLGSNTPISTILDDSVYNTITASYAYLRHGNG